MDYFCTLYSPLSNEIFYPDKWHCMIVICRSTEDPDPPLKRLTLFYGEVTLDRSWRGSGLEVMSTADITTEGDSESLSM